MAKKIKKAKTNNEYFLMNVSKETFEKRAKYICDGDKYIIPLRNLIGEAHGWDAKKVEKNKFTTEFNGFVIDYLKGKK